MLHNLVLQFVPHTPFGEIERCTLPHLGTAGNPNVHAAPCTLYIVYAKLLLVLKRYFNLDSVEGLYSTVR